MHVSVWFLFWRFTRTRVLAVSVHTTNYSGQRQTLAFYVRQTRISRCTKITRSTRNGRAREIPRTQHHDRSRWRSKQNWLVFVASASTYSCTVPTTYHRVSCVVRLRHERPRHARARDAAMVPAMTTTPNARRHQSTTQCCCVAMDVTLRSSIRKSERRYDMFLLVIRTT